MQVEFSIGDALGSNAIAYVVFIIEVPLEFALSIVDCALDHHGVEVIQFREHLIVHVGACLVLRPVLGFTENARLPYLTKIQINATLKLARVIIHHNSESPIQSLIMIFAALLTIGKLNVSIIILCHCYVMSWK